MELLAPAGNPEKLQFAYLYGADAAYTGVPGFSLRSAADGKGFPDPRQLTEIRKAKKLYGAMNIYFHQQDLRRLEESLDTIKEYPFDALIITDIGLVPLLKRAVPNMELHLSTQANCTNSESVKMYRDMGFTRIIPGREISLREIDDIKNSVSDMEIEIFVHGAMCLAYSGRCFLSAYMIGRSGNKGDCAHSCRWNYRYLEEQERPGEYFPVIEGDGFTTILSSKDLCMIDHLKEAADAGVDSVKIEGRMKSLYYTSLVTRAYRKAIDFQVLGKRVDNIEGFTREIEHVSHREYSTGFYISPEDIQESTQSSYMTSHLFLGVVTRCLGGNRYTIDIKNSFGDGDTIEYLGPDTVCTEDSLFRLTDGEGNPAAAVHHHMQNVVLETDIELDEGFIIRKRKDAS